MSNEFFPILDTDYSSLPKETIEEIVRYQTKNKRERVVLQNQHGEIVAELIINDNDLIEKIEFQEVLPGVKDAKSQQI